MRNPTGGKGWCRSRGRRHESDERAERAESGTDERCLIYERRETPGPSPDPWDLTPCCQSQSFNYDEAGATPALTWFWPRSRRSGCFPAEPYSPLRSLVVYLNGNVQLKKNQKWGLTSAALSDMDINAYQISRQERSLLIQLRAGTLCELPLATPYFGAPSALSLISHPRKSVSLKSAYKLSLESHRPAKINRSTIKNSPEGRCYTKLPGSNIVK